MRPVPREFTPARTVFSISPPCAPAPGTKNVMGGVLYRQPTGKVIPGWWREAPIERPIVEERMWMLTEDSMVQAGFKSIPGMRGTGSLRPVRQEATRYYVQFAVY